MKEQFDDFQKFMEEEFNREGEEIEQKVKANPEVAGLKAGDELKEKLDRKIEAYEEERRRELISMLSEEDREALALGREVKEKEAREEKSRAAKKRTRIWKRLGAAAAVVALVLTVGITGVGGPKRLVEVVKQTFGGRELEKITSSINNNVIDLEDSEEEKAYQKIKDVFNVEPVRIVPVADDVIFKQIEIDEYMQSANLIYEVDEMTASYIINFSYAEDAFGIDMEDDLLDTYNFPLKDVDVEIKEYAILNSDKKRYAAKFEYESIHYRFIATTNKEKFELILNFLHFS